MAGNTAMLKGGLWGQSPTVEKNVLLTGAESTKACVTDIPVKVVWQPYTQSTKLGRLGRMGPSRKKQSGRLVDQCNLTARLENTI